MRVFSAILIFVALFLTACASGDQTVLYIETHTSIIKVGERIPLTATTTEVLGSPPEWEVYELDGGTLMRTTGNQVTYIAPPYAGAYRVIARATRLNGEKVRAGLTIIVQPQISIEPTSTKVVPGETYAFTAKVKGVELSKVQWSIDEHNGGSITSTGIYTAPASPGLFTIVATVMTEGRPTATATVQVALL